MLKIVWFSSEYHETENYHICIIILGIPKWTLYVLFIISTNATYHRPIFKLIIVIVFSAI